MKQNAYSLLAGLTALVGLPASAATSVLTSGHVDFIGIGYDAGAFEPHSHAEAGALVDGTPLANDREFELGELIVQTSLSTFRSSGAAWDPVGIAAGQSFWTLSETEIAGQPFVGIGAEELLPGDWSSPITITLTGVTGPAGGKFSLWQTDGGVPTFFMSTNDGISGSDVFSMNLNVQDHAHFGWGFTEQGTYDLTFEIAGTHLVDGFQSANATYSVSVVPEPSSSLLLLGVFGGLGFRRCRK